MGANDALPRVDCSQHGANTIRPNEPSSAKPIVAAIDPNGRTDKVALFIKSSAFCTVRFGGRLWMVEF
jgi:hypothetical protein